MKKVRLLLPGIIAIVFAIQVLAQDRKLQMHAVAFYNLENLFDTCHDAGKNDWEFLPDGTYHWTKIKYEHKLANMARVLSELGSDKLPYGASIIGVSEVENSKALDDLMAQPAMKKRGFRYVHIEGPDKRGVDCALIYNPRAFKVVKTFNKDYVYENGDTVRRTRPFFCVQGKLAGDNVTVVVCHWPSRAAEGVFREYGGRQVRALTDSISNADPTQHIIVMGDMNDDPDNASMAQCLGAKRKIKEVEKGDFYNPAHAENLKQVKELAAGMRLLVKSHMQMPTRVQNVCWRLLLRHAEYIEGVAEFMTEKALGHDRLALEKAYAFFESFGKYEYEIERYFDNGLAMDSWEVFAKTLPQIEL